MPHRVRDGGAGFDTRSLQRLYDLAMLDVQRPGNIGAGLKLLETLTVTGFKPRGGGKA